MVVRAETSYYDVLGVSKDADAKTIKQAYRQKARKYHPVRSLPLMAGLPFVMS